MNSKKRNFTPASLERRIREIDVRVAQYLAELDTRDCTEASIPAATAAELQEKIGALHERKSRYESFRGEMEASGESQRSETDPDSRSMKVYGGVDVCYNVQTAVEEKHKLIVAHDVTNDATDRDYLSPMARAANEVLDSNHLQVIADMGYYNGPEITACLDAGITPSVPRPRTSANAKHGLFTKDDFKYDAGEDRYRCPAGESLTYRFSTVEQGRGMRYYSTGACGRCAMKARCTRSQQSRRITRWENEAVLEAMEQRLKSRPELLSRRKAIVEHPFGSMKRWMDQGYFLMKGLEKVGAEFSLTVLAYNLRRVITLLGVPRMMAALAQ